MSLPAPAAADPTALVGEVVGASLYQVVAETPRERLYAGPAFGSFIRCDSPDGDDIFAVVVGVETSSLEPNRRATAFWQAEEDLRQNQPQIFELLTTNFTGLVVAHRRQGLLRCGIPPRPPRVHGFVYRCTDDEVEQITGDPGLLRLLVSAPLAQQDDLTAAVLREGFACRSNDRAYLIRTGKQLALLLRDDYQRLQSILRMAE